MWLSGRYQIEGTAAAGLRWNWRRWRMGRVGRPQKSLESAPLMGRNQPLRKVALSPPEGWAPSQAYPRALQRLNTKSGQGRAVEGLPHRKEGFTFLCIC